MTLLTRIEALVKEPPPGILYHYTSPVGARGIIEEKSLWATNIHYLNDSKEFGHAREIAVREIAGLRQSRSNAVPLWEHLERWLTSVRLQNIHVFSLSTHGDQLSQWRAYCRGGGYALGFSPPELVERMKLHGFYFASCIYDTTRQTDLISDCLSLSLNVYDGAIGAGQDPRDARIKAETQFALNFSILGPLCKHPSFEEEGEWRLVAPGVDIRNPLLCYKAGSGMLIPYLNCPVDPLPLCAATVAPGPEPVLADRSLYGLLWRNNQPRFTIAVSQIPYRGL